MCPTGTTPRLVNDFSTDDMSEFRQAFEVIDVDHDGKISGDDLYSFYASVFGGINADEEEMIRAMISLADANKDGYVQYEEFEKMLKEENCSGDSAVMEDVFKLMDKDSDGKLGVDDLKSYLNWAGIKVEDDEIKAMIKLGCGEGYDGVSFVALLISCAYIICMIWLDYEYVMEGFLVCENFVLK